MLARDDGLPRFARNDDRGRGWLGRWLAEGLGIRSQFSSVGLLAVTPAKAGVQCWRATMDSRLRGNDESEGRSDVAIPVGGHVKQGLYRYESLCPVRVAP
jgi:hypothetical protein